MLTDLRYALRLLRRSPAFTLAAVLTLALGIGANTAIYSVLQAVWIDAVPFDDPGRLMVVSSAGAFSKTMAVSEEDFRDWRADNRAFASLAATEPGGTVRVNDRPLATMRASAELFATLGARMHLGRPLLASDYEAAAPIVAVIGYRTWQQVFGGDRGVIGRTFESQSGPVEIVGIAPPDFKVSAFDPAAWVSRKLVPTPPGQRGGRSLQVIGRLRTEVSIDEARIEMNGLAARLAAARPDSNAQWAAATVTPIRERLAGAGVGHSLWMLLGATGIVLLIACANVANLFLARGASRRRELAVRAAVGARPAHIVRQLLCESALIALGGTAAGLLLTLWARDAIVAALPPNLHRGGEVGIDQRVFLFTLAVGVFTALLTGLMPAWRGSLARPFDLLTAAATQHGSTHVRRRLTAGLVAAEVALAVVVLSVAGLLVGSFVKLRAVDPGFMAQGILTFTVARDPGRTATTHTDQALHEQILNALSTVAEVQGASAGEMLPLSGNRSRYGYELADDPGAASRRVHLDQRSVAPGYFEIMGIAVTQGRSFAASGDMGGAVMINERAARELWPGLSAVGRQLVNGASRSTVIGVVADVRHVALDADAVPEIYHPSRSSSRMTYVVRTAGEPRAHARAILSAVEAAVPVRLADVGTLDQLVDASVRVPAFRARLFGLMGLLVALLAVIGVVSVTAYAVADRRREIGIRIALGARPSRTLRLMMRQALVPVSVGVLAGLTVAFNTNRLVAHFLYATSPADPITMAAVVAAVCAASCAAAYFPARRALSIDPTLALRAD
jgi:putative ABC transport system permease protein